MVKKSSNVNKARCVGVADC